MTPITTLDATFNWHLLNEELEIVKKPEIMDLMIQPETIESFKKIQKASGSIFNFSSIVKTSGLGILIIGGTYVAANYLYKWWTQSSPLNVAHQKAKQQADGLYAVGENLSEAQRFLQDTSSQEAINQQEVDQSLIQLDTYLRLLESHIQLKQELHTTQCLCLKIESDNQLILEKLAQVTSEKEAFFNQLWRHK